MGSEQSAVESGQSKPLLATTCCCLPTISPMLSALIFDMDDLLVFSAPLWAAAEETLLRALGAQRSEELAARYKGMNALDVTRVIHEALHPPLPLAKCQKIMRDALIAAFSADLRPMPGAVELVRRVRGRWPMAVASGSPPPAIERALTALGIRDRFDHIISSESVARGKPHPDVFLAAAAALGVPPPQCLVLEDSLIGVHAARAAGMRVFAVPSGHHEQVAREATRVFASLAEISLDDLEPDAT